MKKLLFLFLIALVGCKKDSTNSTSAISGSWALQTTSIVYYNEQNEKIYETSPSELQYFKNIAITANSLSIIKDGNNSIAASKPKTLSDIITLPLHLITFTGELQQDTAVILNWKTTSEVNLHYFQLQRSNNGINFFKIVNLISIGTSIVENINNYSAYDATPSFGNNYYRIMMVDNDGQGIFSSVRIIEVNQTQLIPIKEGENYKVKFANRLAGAFSKVTISKPSLDILEWRASANDVKYFDATSTEKQAHHAELKMVFARK